MGPSYAAKTIGYSSRFLAYGTVANPGPNCDEQYIQGGFHTIDFSELYYTPIVTSTAYKAGCSPYANPRLSLPAELTNVDPAWKTCQPLYYGAFDPPSVLSKASRLAPAQADPAAVTPTPPPVPTLPAAAQAIPAAQTPAATPAPNDDGRKTAAVDPPAPVMDTKDGNGNTNKIVPTPAASPKDSDPNSQKAATINGDPSRQAIPPAPAVLANSPVQDPSPGTDPNSQKEAGGKEDPSGQGIGAAAAVIVNSPVQSPASAANVVVAQGTTLTENGPPASIGGKAAVYYSGSVYVDSTPLAIPTSAPASPAKAVVAQGQTLTEGGPSANVGGKAAVYSAGSIYLGSSTPIAVPKAEDNNVVVAQGQTLTENGSTASIGGKAAVYSAGSLYYDSTPIPIPKASPTNVVVVQGQTLSENGPSAVVGGKTALYKAGSIYYDSTPVAVPTSAQGQQNPPPVVAAGVTFAPTVQNPTPVVANGITFAPAVEKVSPVVAGGITFAPVSHSILGDGREPVVAGGITFQPTFVQSPDAVALETPAPLEIANRPVIKAANGGLVIAGTTIPPGVQTSLFGHVISVGASDVVDDGKTLTFASKSEAAARTSVASLIYGSSDIVTTLTPGATYASGGHITTYTGPTPSAFTETASSVIGTTTVPLQASALPSQIFVEASPSSAVEYVLNGKTATVASPSDVPLGGLILYGFHAVPTNSSVLPAVVLLNGTVASAPMSGVRSSPSSTSPSRTFLGTGSRAMGCWISTSGYNLMVLGYILVIALITIFQWLV